VGAGLAGTTAAYRLAQQGVHVQLFEARDRIGGRCWTARGFADGQMAEHVFANAEPHVVGPEPLVTQIAGYINDVVPGTQQQYIGPAWLDYWTGDPWTRGSYAAYLPGQLAKYWGYVGIPNGNVHFAGEHTSTYSQGYLNGGVESGQRTAIEVMRKLGVPVPASIASLPYSNVPGHTI
jgi:monoamine oxidase